MSSDRVGGTTPGRKERARNFRDERAGRGVKGGLRVGTNYSAHASHDDQKQATRRLRPKSRRSGLKLPMLKKSITWSNPDSKLTLDTRCPLLFPADVELERSANMQGHLRSNVTEPSTVQASHRNELIDGPSTQWFSRPRSTLNLTPFSPIFTAHYLIRWLTRRFLVQSHYGSVRDPDIHQCIAQENRCRLAFKKLDSLEGFRVRCLGVPDETLLFEFPINATWGARLRTETSGVRDGRSNSGSRWCIFIHGDKIAKDA
ncbi:hypothetical protein EDD85DRAFT_1021038 [Armillaria nabsnona]|nr:hypothetical protein EDD85DRAFT_1021038 [Armillaria nabsnona]